MATNQRSASGSVNPRFRDNALPHAVWYQCNPGFHVSDIFFIFTPCDLMEPLTKPLSWIDLDNAEIVGVDLTLDRLADYEKGKLAKQKIENCSGHFSTIESSEGAPWADAGLTELIQLKRHRQFFVLTEGASVYSTAIAAMAASAGYDTYYVAANADSLNALILHRLEMLSLTCFEFSRFAKECELE